jgi:hypothetical protein
MTFPEKFETFGGPRSEWKRELEIGGRVGRPGLTFRPWVWLSWLLISLQLCSVRVANIGTVTELKTGICAYWKVQRTARYSASDRGSDCTCVWERKMWDFVGFWETGCELQKTDVSCHSLSLIIIVIKHAFDNNWNKQTCFKCRPK